MVPTFVNSTGMIWEQALKLFSVFIQIENTLRFGAVLLRKEKLIFVLLML